MTTTGRVSAAKDLVGINYATRQTGRETTHINVAMKLYGGIPYFMGARRIFYRGGHEDENPPAGSREKLPERVWGSRRLVVKIMHK